MLIRFEKIDSRRDELIILAWSVLAAAKDIGDLSTALVARAVIDAYLQNRTPRASDVRIIENYF